MGHPYTGGDQRGVSVFFSAAFFTVAGFVAAGAFLTLGAFFVVVFEFGGSEAGESLISMSKIAPSSADSIVGAPCLARVGAAGVACSINSCLSTPRSSKSNSGDESRRFPIPYITAARCLHIPA